MKSFTEWYKDVSLRMGIFLTNGFQKETCL